MSALKTSLFPVQAAGALWRDCQAALDRFCLRSPKIISPRRSARIKISPGRDRRETRLLVTRLRRTHPTRDGMLSALRGRRRIMAEERVERRLAAVLAADVAGYSRLMGADEEGTHAALTALRRELSDPKIGEHRGRIVKTTGDGLLVEFPSVVDAVRCAVELQREMALRSAEMGDSAHPVPHRHQSRRHHHRRARYLRRRRQC